MLAVLEKQKQKYSPDIFHPFPLILLHTPFGLKFFDYVAKTRVAKAYARANTYLMPFITVIAILLIVGGISTLISRCFCERMSGDRSQRKFSNPHIPTSSDFLHFGCSHNKCLHTRGRTWHRCKSIRNKGRINWYCFCSLYSNWAL